MDDQWIPTISVIVPSTMLIARIPGYLDKSLHINLDTQMQFPNMNSIDLLYVDRVSITHGHSSPSRIWTFAADGNEASNSCPCEGGGSAPSFVGNNCYCESGYNNGTYIPSSVLYTSDPLWDGAQCEGEGSCCSTAPWFTVDLVNSTSDDIEVRICSDSFDGEEDTPIHLLELYIQ